MDRSRCCGRFVGTTYCQPVADAAIVQEGSPLHDLLLDVRQKASDNALVTDFVRVYTPVQATTVGFSVEGDQPAPFLSVLMRTQGTRLATFQDALLSLAAQSEQDFEVLVLAHRVEPEALTHLGELVSWETLRREGLRLFPSMVVEGLDHFPSGVEKASGNYVAILDDDDIVFGHSVEDVQGIIRLKSREGAEGTGGRGGCRKHEMGAGTIRVLERESPSMSMAGSL